MRMATQDNVDLVFRAFADRTRLRILSLLRSGEEICVCDLVRVLKIPQARVSRHLAYLRRARLVVGRRDQQWMHYRLSEPTSAVHAKLLECLSCCLGELPTLKCDQRRLVKCCPNSACCE